MIVQLKTSNDSENKDWCILEFQGEIIGDEIAGFLGSLRMQGDDVMMGIGQHVMWGKVVTLSNPFLVVDQTESGLETKGFAYKKIIFNDRPKPKTADNSKDLMYHDA
jgi:hypothetical protein